MSRTYPRLLLLLGLGLSASGGQFACPAGLACHCFEHDVNDVRIHCGSGARPDSGFDLSVRSGEQVRVQCRGDSPDWTDFLNQDKSLEVGEVGHLVLAQCQPLDKTEAELLLRRLGVSFQSLRYERIKGKIEARHLEQFKQIDILELTGNNLGEVDVDLLRGLPKLRYLGLRNTNIAIPAGFFRNSSTLRVIELSGNRLKSLKPGTFDGLSQIRQLNLWNNELSNLSPETFRNLRSLAILDLNRNAYETLPIELFKDLENLEVINLSWSPLIELPAGLFQHNRRLREFKLNYNQRNLTQLPGQLLAQLPELLLVSLKRSGLRALPEDLIWGSKKIERVDLSRNFLETLPAGLLRNAEQMLELSVSFNELSELPDYLFKTTAKMVKLDLSLNHLVAINESTLDGLVSLQELNLEKNNLNFIHMDAFSSLKKLKVLKLASNELTLQSSLYDIFGPVSPFHHCLSIQELYLARNNISELYSDWVISNTQLRKLDLSYNSFEILQAEDLQFTSNNVEIDLRHNAIEVIDLSRLELVALSQVPSTTNSNDRNVRFQLDDNPIRCDCDVYSLLRYLNNAMVPAALHFASLQTGETQCAGPRWTRGVKLTDMRADELTCRLESKPGEQAHPEDPCDPRAPLCDCWLKPSEVSLVVDCADRQLEHAPRFLDASRVNSVRLDLGDNNIREQPDMRAPGYDKVQSLNLAGNRIAKVDESLITPNLKVLNLESNNLTSLSSKVLEKLANSSSLMELTLHGNPWRCDCEARNLLNFVQSNFVNIPDLLNLTCANSDTILSDLTVSELCPFSYLYVIVLSFIGLFGLFLGVLLALYYRFEKRIKIWLYSKNLCLWFVTEEELDRDKAYDAFVSYSHKDESIVEQLVSRLESGGEHGGGYRLCIHTRDWAAGEWIPVQIERSVEQSRRTIVVLSRNFIESHWSKLEFQTAYMQVLKERRNRVIIIVLGQIGSLDDLDPQLREYVRTNTYLSWGEPWFWQKLMYAMPHITRASRNARERKEREARIDLEIGKKIGTY